MIYLILFWEFFQTGLFSIGGGLATLPFLSRMGETYGWFTEQDLANMLAVSESTPGPIGINMATYVGNTVAGVPGALISTFALVLPSYVVILLVFKIMTRFKENAYVQSVMAALRPASLGMVVSAVLGVIGAVLINQHAIQTQQWGQVVSLPSVVLFAVLLTLYIKCKKVHPVVLLALGAAAGILLKL